jgi:hypothetical protein
MRRFTPVLIACFISLPVFAQQPGATASFNEAQIAAIYGGIAKHAARLEPMLGQVRPADWVAKGAPDTYVTQFNRTIGEIREIQTEMAALAQQPGQMSATMKALFRVQTTHQLLGSLMGGLRKYQNPALADLIEAVAAEDQGELTQLQQYLVELASDKDEQFRLVDSEAQRCRAALSRQPAPPPARKAQ